MYDIESWGSAITTFLNFVGSISWPIIVLIIICIFKKPISERIANLKTLKGKGWMFEFFEHDDKFKVKLQPPTPALKAQAAEISRLSDEEIEQSRQRAQKRLREDTKRVGYQRGRLFQLDSGKWAIAWDLEVSDGIILKDS